MNKPNAPGEGSGLPALDIIQADHDKYDAEWESRWDGYPVDAICAQLYCRERQLKAALSSPQLTAEQLLSFLQEDPGPFTHADIRSCIDVINRGEQ